MHHLTICRMITGRLFCEVVLVVRLSYKRTNILIMSSVNEGNLSTFVSFDLSHTLLRASAILL